MKTIKSTAASISSSIKTISQDLFSRKIDPVVLNNGYKEFYARYEEDMKRLEESLKAMEIASSHITDEWRASEEEQKKRIAELQEENKRLRDEKNELESSLRSTHFTPSPVGSTIQSLELGNEEMKSELLKMRVEYKVSVGVEDARDSAGPGGEQPSHPEAGGEGEERGGEQGRGGEEARGGARVAQDAVAVSAGPVRGAELACGDCGESCGGAGEDGPGEGGGGEEGCVGCDSMRYL